MSKNNFHSNNKIKEAEFFLGKIHETEDDVLIYYISAFLSAWRSVFDIILYDAAICFNLGFNRNEDMRDWHFNWAAKRMKHKGALNFIKWWKQTLTTLRKDPLFEQRSIIIHRGIPEIPTGTITLDLTPSASSAFSMDVMIDGDNTFDDYYPIEHDVTYSTYEQALAKMKKVHDEAIQFMN
ncbi:MAG: hypothetical protein ACTSQH_02765 [Candidatus Hodarchaeales archaeon]